MAGEADEMRGRLAAAGWTVRELRERWLVVEGETMDVTLGYASRAALRACFVRLGQCVDGDFIDTTTSPLRPLVASARVGATKFRAEVLDLGRATEELAALEPLYRAGSLAASVALVAARGFTIDFPATVEDQYDEFHRDIVARRAGEHLSVSFAYRGNEPARGIVLNELLSHAEMHKDSFTLSVRVWSLAHAEELVALLAPPR